jgi:uncharacterized protein YqhQ
MIGQVFILVSFILGALAGSLVTYAIMGSYFSKAVSEISNEIKSKDDDEKEEKQPSKIHSIELSYNTKVIIGFVLALVLLVIVAIFVVATGIRPTSEGEENVRKSLGGKHDIDSINDALKKGVGGY